jgi:hypothetical protein
MTPSAHTCQTFHPWANLDLLTRREMSHKTVINHKKGLISKLVNSSRLILETTSKTIIFSKIRSQMFTI